ncbi:MAG TPA: hypothetical protein VG815_16230 [Chloroflexota bacterium]|nr:hypothetical protein [Chloroflexota bacterium]
MSERVSQALNAQAEHDRKLEALGDAIADYEPEAGETRTRRWTGKPARTGLPPS